MNSANETMELNRTGIAEDNAKAGARELNILLADEMALYIKTLKFHWNLEGPGFHDLHLFLDKQYNQLQEIVDEVAERIRKIGHFANGSMKKFLKDTSIKENEHDRITPNMLVELANDHDEIIRKIREMIGQFDDEYEDAGSADMLTQLLRDHEKMSWMLHASVK